MTTEHKAEARKKEIKEIIDGAGEKKTWVFNTQFPFIHKYTWVFGGWCGGCGKWNWQWRMIDSIFGATYLCKTCQQS